MAQASRWPLLAACFARLGLPVVVVDLETTGGNMYQDRVTEVALLRFEKGQVAGHRWLVNPEQPISAFITRLTGIDDGMVADAPRFADIAPELLPLLRGALVVAHNSRFDYTFLRHEFRRAGMDFAAPALCTVQLSRRLYPQFFKHNLDSIIERFGIATASRHRAMDDVLALVAFLEKSIAHTGAGEWENHCRALMNPQMLPSWLPEKLAGQLYALPDGHGVLVWLDKHGQALQVAAHEKAFAETARLLHGKKIPAYAQMAASVQFLPALGALHAVWLKAQMQAQHRLRPSESAKTYLTVRFASDEHERLQARIVPLGNGSHAARPYGLFLHKKSAKRALAQWAQEQGLCPSSLNILPETHAKGVPCPVQAVGHCDGGCQTQQGAAEQNSRISREAGKLPVADWGSAHEVQVVETDALSGLSVTLHCVGGALALPDGRWYFDDNLPLLLKAKFKLGKDAVKVLA
ncbi:MAG: exonuclease domain-containing protein [Neisseria sp.]|nr:exonuclease domain-containing protein [Neisseria sp.]